MNLIRVLTLLLGVVLCWRPASAAVVTYDFTATVTSQSGLGLSTGDPLTGSFSYDDAAPDFNFGNPYVGLYFQSQSLHFNVGALSVSMPVSFIEIQEGEGVNPDRVRAGYGGNDPWSMVMSLTDTDQTVFSSDALPSVLPDLGEFEERTIAFTRYDEELNVVGSFTVDITALALRAVPEPSSLAMSGGILVLGGLFAAGLAARRGTRSSGRSAAA